MEVAIGTSDEYQHQQSDEYYHHRYANQGNESSICIFRRLNRNRRNAEHKIHNTYVETPNEYHSEDIG